jgi:hypothetical protein
MGLLHLQQVNIFSPFLLVQPFFQLLLFAFFTLLTVMS